MPLVTTEQALDCLRSHIEDSSSIDIAVAWASPSEPLDLLLNFAKKRNLRALVGVAGNATHPEALRLLYENAELRIPQNPPLFHPKLYLFHKSKSARTIAWVGSANLTRPGFAQNVELLFETEDDGSMARWFSEQWGKLKVQETSRLVNKYANEWSPQTPPLYFEVGDTKLNSRRVSSLRRDLTDWRSYVEALKAANFYWSKKGTTIDGDVQSWLHTATRGKELMRRANWDELTRDEYFLLMGLNHELRYSTLGSMRGAGKAKKIFNRSSNRHLKIRRQIREGIEPILKSDIETFAASASEFIEMMTKIEGFSGAIATRFLALARPDLGVSVNKGSAIGLAKYSALPRTSLNKPHVPGRGKSYVDLINFLCEQPWYSNPLPKSRYEQELANFRGALLDCLVYQGTI